MKRHISMILDITDILFSFTLFSMLGWVIEVVYRSTRDKRFVNPGLLKGPYLILYGTAALVLMACVSLIHEYNIFVKILCYFLITTGLELISGFTAQHFFNVRLWDYSDEPFQFKGHICLKFSIYWVILAFAFEYLVLPPYQSLVNSLSPFVKGVLGATGVLIMLIDFVLITRKKTSRLAGYCGKEGNLR